jgi:DNA-binding CsgD family transcriptional regulator
MSTPVRASEQDLRALAAIVSQDRPDLPAGEGLPPSLLADLMGQIRCEAISLERYDSGRQAYGLLQATDDDPGPSEDWVQVMWTHYWDCQHCSYPGRTGDLRSVVKPSDFYSARQWHSSGMYIDCIRPQGVEHYLMLALPEPPEPAAGPGPYLRLVLFRGPGPDFSERDRALLTLLRPHLHQAYLDAERRRHPVPRLTPRQNDLLYLVAAGHTNNQIARRLGISEATVRTHLENIYERLNVSSRTAAVTRAFPGRVASLSGPRWRMRALMDARQPAAERRTERSAGRRGRHACSGESYRFGNLFRSWLGAWGSGILGR